MANSSRAVLDRLDPRVPETMISRLESDQSPAPVPATLAASVILVGDHGGLQTYVLHRHSTMPFAAGMVVFPGGRVDPAAAGDDDQQTLLSCAVRETEEETGVRLRPAELRYWVQAAEDRRVEPVLPRPVRNSSCWIFRYDDPVGG